MSMSFVAYECPDFVVTFGGFLPSQPGLIRGNQGCCRGHLTDRAALLDWQKKGWPQKSADGGSAPSMLELGSHLATFNSSSSAGHCPHSLAFSSEPSWLREVGKASSTSSLLACDLEGLWQGLRFPETTSQHCHSPGI